MTSRLPSLNGLRAFEAAGRLLSFTRAAQELNVTQTAISHQIRRLEEELGIRLFDRHTRTLTLTGEAQAFLPAVRAAFADLQRATDRLRRSDRARILTVSTVVSLAAKWLLPRLASFQEQAPDIDVRITTSTSLVDFRREDVDVAVRYGRGDWPGLRADWLMAEDLFPVCSPALLAGPRPLSRPEDLARHTLLHVSAYQDEWRLWFTAAGVPTEIGDRPGLTFDMAFMALQAAVDGHGVALGRTPYVEADLAAGRLVAPFDMRITATSGFYFVCPLETADTPKIAAFRKWLLASVNGEASPAPGGISRRPAAAPALAPRRRTPARRPT